jgi:hypothetical protein
MHQIFVLQHRKEKAWHRVRLAYEQRSQVGRREVLALRSIKEQFVDRLKGDPIVVELSSAGILK